VPLAKSILYGEHFSLAASISSSVESGYETWGSSSPLIPTKSIENSSDLGARPGRMCGRWSEHLSLLSQVLSCAFNNAISQSLEMLIELVNRLVLLTSLGIWLEISSRNPIIEAEI